MLGLLFAGLVFGAYVFILWLIGNFGPKDKEPESDCEFAKGWRNTEGWLVMENGKLVCGDWDEYCTLCRKDDSKDYVIGVRGD